MGLLNQKKLTCFINIGEDLKVEEVIRVVRELRERGIILSPFGREVDPDRIVKLAPDSGTRVEKFDTQRIRKAIAQIRYLFKPARTWSLGSYGSKHDLENWPERNPGDYITNGDFIIAMLLCGYKARFDDGPNAEFKGRKAFDRPAYC